MKMFVHPVIAAFAAIVSVSSYAGMAEFEVSLPEAELPNTEVLTNIALNVNMERLVKMNFRLDFLGSISNSLTIAVGTDFNGDGDLSLEEADIEFGYDCGQWVSATTVDGNVDYESAPDEGRVFRMYSISRRDFDPAWNMVRFVRRGCGDIDEHVMKDEDRVKFVIHVVTR